MAASKEVMDGKFIVHNIPPFDALALLGDLQKELAPVLGALTDLVGDKDEDVDLQKLLEVLSPRLSGDKLISWSDRLLKQDYISAVINDNAVPLDKKTKELAFNDPMQILELMFELLRFNFEAPLRTFASRFGKLTEVPNKAK